MAGLDIDTLNTKLKVKTCIFTCRYSSNMGIFGPGVIMNFAICS